MAIIWGSTFTFNKMALDGLTPISLMAARFMIAFIIMLNLSFISILADITSPTSLSVLYLGIIGTAVAYYMQILCQRYTNPTATSIILSMEAVFGTLIAVIVLGEFFTVKMIFGSIDILASIFISELNISLVKGNSPGSEVMDNEGHRGI